MNDDDESAIGVVTGYAEDVGEEKYEDSDGLWPFLTDDSGTTRDGGVEVEGEEVGAISAAGNMKVGPCDGKFYWEEGIQPGLYRCVDKLRREVLSNIYPAGINVGERRWMMATR